MAGNYWTATDDAIRENGGRNPVCPNCDEEMYAMDDHGRFACTCGYQNPAAQAQERLSRALFPKIWALVDAQRQGEKKDLGDATEV